MLRTRLTEDCLLCYHVFRNSLCALECHSNLSCVGPPGHGQDSAQGWEGAQGDVPAAWGQGGREGGHEEGGEGDQEHGKQMK